MIISNDISASFYLLYDTLTPWYQSAKGAAALVGVVDVMQTSAESSADLIGNA
jgi:hypothetical protein